MSVSINNITRASYQKVTIISIIKNPKGVYKAICTTPYGDIIKVIFRRNFSWRRQLLMERFILHQFLKENKIKIHNMSKKKENLVVGMPVYVLRKEEHFIAKITALKLLNKGGIQVIVVNNDHGFNRSFQGDKDEEIFNPAKFTLSSELFVTLDKACYTRLAVQQCQNKIKEFLAEIEYLV